MFLLFLLGFALDSPVVVTNPLEPGPHTVQFKEDLRFGGTGEENKLWTDGQISVFFSVDPSGHFFICDVKATTILEFDNRGDFIRKIAVKGEGPGEYQNIVSFSVLENGNMVGLDSLRAVSKFNYYDKDGKLIDSKSINDATRMFRRTVFAPNGEHFFSGLMSQNRATQSMDYKTGYFNADLNEIKTLSVTSRPRPSGPPQMDKPEWWINVIADQLKDYLERGVAFMRFLPNNDVLVVRDKHYEIEKWSADLKTKQMVIKKEFKPVPFDEDDKDALVDWLRESIFEQSPQIANVVTSSVLRKATEKAELPLTQVPIADILPMEDGQFLTVDQTSFRTGKVSGHIFDKEGKCVGSYQFPGQGVYDLFGTRISFKNGFAYAMERNEDGDNVMVRYTYELVKK